MSKTLGIRAVPWLPLLLALACSDGDAPAPEDTADVIYQGGPILTMNRAVGEANVRAGVVESNMARIEQTLAAIGVAAPEVWISPVQRIERTATGKLRRFVPLAGGLWALRAAA